MLAAGLVCFSMITVLAAVAHGFHRARVAPELLVGHALGLTSVFLVVFGADTGVGAVFSGYAIAMLLSIAQGPASVVRVVIRVVGALAITAAIGLDTLALLGHATPIAARLVLAAAVVCVAALALRPSLARATATPPRIATVASLALFAIGGALSLSSGLLPFAGVFLLPLIAAHALTTLLRVAPERLPALADVTTACIAAIVAAAASLAMGGPMLAVGGLAAASALAITSLSRLLVGNARVFSLGAVQRPARPIPALPLDELQPLYERFPTATPARGQASARSLLEDAVEGSSGRFVVDDRTLDADVHGDLPRIVSALRSTLSAASLDDEVVRVVMRAGPRNIAYELDHAIPEESVDRARGLLANHGGRVYVSSGPGATQIVVPTRPIGGDA